MTAEAASSRSAYASRDDHAAQVPRRAREARHRAESSERNQIAVAVAEPLQPAMADIMR